MISDLYQIKHIFSVFINYRLLIPICILTIQSLDAKNFRLEKYTEVEGLSSSAVNTLYQDSRGYIWIGTEGGLSRFNGYEFRNYSSFDGLNNNFIKAIFEDSLGQLWVGTNEGLNVCDLNAKRTHFRIIAEDLIISSIIEFRGQIYFSSNKGLHYFEGDSLINIELSRIRTLYTDGDQLLIGAVSGLYRFNESEKSIEILDLIPDAEEPFVRAIRQTDEGILLGTDEGMFIWNREDGLSKLKDKSTRSIRVSDFTIDRNNQIWISSETGLWLMNFQNMEFIQPADENLKSDINYSIEDHEGNIWIASSHALLKYTEYPFERLEPFINADERGVSSVLVSKNREIWFGGITGDIKIRDLNNQYREFKSIKNIAGSKPIQKIFEDSKGRIWISTFLKGVFIWDDGKLRPFEDPKGLLKFFTFDIEEDENGNFWFGGARGLLKFDGENFEYFTIKDILQAPFVTDIHSGAKGKIWLAMNSGIGVIEERNIFKISEFDEMASSQIVTDNEGNVYVATDNEGLVKFNYEEGNVKDVKRFNSGNGLSNNSVRSLEINDKGIIWVGTDYGLNRIDLDGNIRIFKVKNDLPASRCYQRAIQSHGDTLIIGTYDGAISLPPDFGRANFIKPRIYITDLKILNKDFDRTRIKSDSGSREMKVNLELPYNANFVSFSYVALSYRNLDDLRYRFRLKGLEESFSEPGMERSFTYANLAPGKYTFEVLAGEGNNWSTEPATYSFIIHPPFWREWWFIILSIATFFILTVSFINFRIRSIRKEEKLKSELNQKIAEFRLIALRSQMNPHFIFNALYSIQHFITTNEKEEAINYLSKFASLIRLILENSGKNEISVSEEMKMLDLYLDLERLRSDNKFEYRIEADQSIHTEDTAIPYLLVQPFVENAVIHGIGNKKGKGNILISFLPFENDEDFIKCIIEDDGVGREKAKEMKRPNPIKRKSMGLEVNKERLEILNPEKTKDTSVHVLDLKDENGEAIGTRVEVIIPVS